MNNFTPKVSIVIPVYNGSNYLAEAIDSALNQTYHNIEIIVINDGSNDNGKTAKIAKSYGDKIRYYEKENGGVATALNLGIEKMTGEYFSWLSHDDMYKPDKVEKQITYLSGLSDKNVVLYSNYDLINENGDLREHRIHNHTILETKPDYAFLRGMINGITVLVPRVAFKKYGEFNPSLRCTQDYDMWFRIYEGYKFAHMTDILALTRIHSGQDTVLNPAAVTEGNALWGSMIANLSDEQKVAAEGSLSMFYLEMIKFLRQTPYVEASNYCRLRLEEAIQSKEIDPTLINKPRRMIKIYELLIEENQKRAAAYYLENATKRLVKVGKVKPAAEILFEILVGKKTDITIGNIEKTYLPRVGNKSKERLLFSSGPWLTGGMERVLSNLFKNLHNKYELFLITPFHGNEGMIELPKYVTHIKIASRLFHDSFDSAALSWAFIFDIDVTIGFWNLCDEQLDFYQLCSGTRVKTVAANNEMYFYPYNYPAHYRLIEKRLKVFRGVDAVLWPTNFSAAAYGISDDNSFWMPNPNTYKVQNKSKYKGEKIILCVGRFNDYVKRIDRILTCFSMVSKRLPDARLVLVGKYDKDIPIMPYGSTTVNDLLKNLGIDERKVEFVGEVDNVEEYYSRASLLLLTSNNEGFGMVINEAASFGVPTIANEIPGIEDLVIDNKNGYLTKQDDIESMADTVVTVLSDQELRNRLGANAKKHVVKFDASVVASRWEYLVKILLEDYPTNIQKQKLGVQLAYELPDYKRFSEILFDEINGVVDTSMVERNSLIESRERANTFSFTNKIVRSLLRLNKSLRKRGLFKTGKMAARLIYRKIR